MKNNNTKIKINAELLSIGSGYWQWLFQSSIPIADYHRVSFWKYVKNEVKRIFKIKKIHLLYEEHNHHPMYFLDEDYYNLFMWYGKMSAIGEVKKGHIYKYNWLKYWQFVEWYKCWKVW